MQETGIEPALFRSKNIVIYGIGNKKKSRPNGRLAKVSENKTLQRAQSQVDYVAAHGLSGLFSLCLNRRFFAGRYADCYCGSLSRFARCLSSGSRPRSAARFFAFHRYTTLKIFRITKRTIPLITQMSAPAREPRVSSVIRCVLRCLTAFRF